MLGGFDENGFQLVSGCSFRERVVVSLECEPLAFVFYTSVADILITKDNNRISQITFWNVIVDNGCLSIFKSWKHADSLYSCESVTFDVEVEMSGKSNCLYYKKYDEASIDQRFFCHTHVQRFHLSPEERWLQPPN